MRRVEKRDGRMNQEKTGIFVFRALIYIFIGSGTKEVDGHVVPHISFLLGVSFIHKVKERS